MPPLRLEVFKLDAKGTQPAEPEDGSDLEEARLAAYEQGYAAGWEDAVAAQADDQHRLRADLARNLQALSFTYHEARAHVLRAIGPLLEAVVSRLLPRVAQEAVAPVVLETLMPLAETLADVPVTIVLNPAARAAVEKLVAQATGLPLTLQEEPSLGEGQVYLKFGDAETRIDLDRATAQISAAVRGFFEPPEKERRHG